MLIHSGLSAECFGALPHFPKRSARLRLWQGRERDAPHSKTGQCVSVLTRTESKFLTLFKEPDLATTRTNKQMTQTNASGEGQRAVYLSIGVLAWNEERNIARTLESLFQQSLFERLSQRGLIAQVFCVANGCTDRTVQIAAEVFEAQSRQHPFARSFECHVVDIRERGKYNAWNVFVHRESAPEAQVLMLMDADILIDHPNTLANMVSALEENPPAFVTTDQPRKHFASKAKKSPAEWLSMRMADMTQAADGQLCGQLYCIRSGVARRIYLPRDIGAIEDGFIKAVVCTEFLTRETTPTRIIRAPDATHTFEAYTTLRAVLKNQKRQMIGQTVVHILVDKYLRTLSIPDRLNLARTVQELERDDPLWVKRLIAEHLERTRFFWRLIPGLASLRFRRLARLRGMQRIACFPAAVAGCLLSMVSCFLARAALVKGQTQYWPHAKSGFVAGKGVTSG